MLPRPRKVELEAEHEAGETEKKKEPVVIPYELCPREIRYLSRKHPIALIVHGFIEDGGVRIDRVELR